MHIVLALLRELIVQRNNKTEILDSLYAFEFHSAHFRLMFFFLFPHEEYVICQRQNSSSTFQTKLKFCANHPQGFSCGLRLLCFRFSFNLRILQASYVNYE